MGRQPVCLARKLRLRSRTYYRWRKEYGGLQVDQARRLKGVGVREREAEAACERAKPPEKLVLKDIAAGNSLRPERRRSAVDHAQGQGLSERKACRLVNQPRGTQRYRPTQREDEDALTRAIVDLASQYGRYGYRRITALLKRDGWKGRQRTASERIWRREGLKVPQRQRPRGRALVQRWLVRSGCGPMHTNHVCQSYDFVSAKTYDGRTVRMLNLIDEHSRECLLIRAERRWSSAKVIEALADVMVIKGVPEHLRSDNGPEFVAHDLRKWLEGLQARRLPTSSRARPGGERLLRELQLEAARRVPQWRTLLLEEGDPCAGRALACPLQHRSASLLARL